MANTKKPYNKIKRIKSISISDEAIEEINKFKNIAWMDTTPFSSFVLQTIRFYITKYKEQETENYPELKKIDIQKII